MFLAVFPAMGVVSSISGWNISILLFTAGLSTLFFYFYTGKNIPIFLGPSFAIMAMAMSVSKTLGPEYAQGDMIVAGVVYLLSALIIHSVGLSVILKAFPPIVVGTMITIIGAYLMPVAISNCNSNWVISIFTLLAILFAYFNLPKHLKIFSILAGYIVGYLIAISFEPANLGAMVQKTSFFKLPHFQFPKFDIGSMISIGIISAIAPQLEHVGDIFAISSIARKDFFLRPGLHRTLSGNGIATIFTAAIGGIGVTSYSEASGAYVINEDYNPNYVVIAGVIALIISFIPVVSVFLMTIPKAAIGAIMLVMFGLISSVGIRTLIIHEVNLSQGKNLLILAIMLSLGIGGAEISIGYFKLSGVALAGIAGIIMNILLPDTEDEDKTEKN